MLSSMAVTSESLGRATLHDLSISHANNAVSIANGTSRHIADPVRQAAASKPGALRRCAMTSVVRPTMTVSSASC